MLQRRNCSFQVSGPHARSSGVYLVQYANGELHIGQTKSLQQRLREHRTLNKDKLHRGNCCVMCVVAFS